MNTLGEVEGKNHSSVKIDEINNLPTHKAPEIVSVSEENHGTGLGAENGGTTVEGIVESKKGWLAYFKTRDFYIVLVLG